MANKVNAQPAVIEMERVLQSKLAITISMEAKYNDKADFLQNEIKNAGKNLNPTQEQIDQVVDSAPELIHAALENREKEAMKSIVQKRRQAPSWTPLLIPIVMSIVYWGAYFYTRGNVQAFIADMICTYLVVKIILWVVCGKIASDMGWGYGVPAYMNEPMKDIRNEAVNVLRRREESLKRYQLTPAMDMLQMRAKELKTIERDIESKLELLHDYYELPTATVSEKETIDIYVKAINEQVNAIHANNGALYTCPSVDEFITNTWQYLEYVGSSYNQI